MRRQHRFIGGVLALCLLLAFRPAAAGFEQDVQGFIQALSGEAIESLTKNGIPRDQRIRNFRHLFKKNFDVAAIGQWILGRYWRKASAAEKTEFLVLFEDLMVVSYVDRFAQYTGDDLKVDRTIRNGEDNATVYSRIDAPEGGKPIRVDWRVVRKDKDFKIVDVIVEGTSMSTTLRSDFSSTIRREGGQVAGLLKVLREKTKTLK